MRVFDLKTTTSFVVANMVGTGVFTSLGFQLLDINSPFAIMMLWVIGGIAAFTGGLSYVCLADLLPRSGGEYNFITQIYGRTFGFVAGFITITVGFAAPIAGAAIAFGKYAQNVVPMNSILLGVLATVLITLVHVYDTKKGGDFHWWVTLLKILLIVVFIGAAFTILAEPQAISILPQANDGEVVLSTPFAVSLVYVTYAYTGWNAAVYIMDEVENPTRNLPIAILLGTIVVMVLYVLLNYVFLYASPMDALRGQLEVGQVAAKSIFGEMGAKLMSGLIAFGLIATMSAMLVGGSRVAKVMSEDFPKLAFLGKTNKKQSPVIALAVIALISVALVLTASFDVVITYAGFILGFFSMTAVIGLFILKRRHPDRPLAYGAWFFPIVPLIFIGINLWIIVFVVSSKPVPSLMALSTFVIGYGVYLLFGREEG